jgi:tetratricopeptide (TPR) repeat protein
MEKGAGRTIPPEVKLEIALAAISSHNYALAAYYLDDLTDEKNPRLKAGAYNALGVIALRDDRVPEAVLYFREALKAVGNYKPALLNLGFSALKGGDLTTAKTTLAKVEGDWFVQYGMISVARMDNDVGLAVEGCDRVLKKEPQHIATLFNCGLLEYQNKHNAVKAKEYLTRAGKAKGGEADWGEKSFLLISKIDAEAAQAKQEEARRKASAAQQKPVKAGPSGAEGAARPAPGGANSPASSPPKAGPG